MSRTSIVLIVAMLFSSAYAQDNWPRFRGPQAAGVTKDDPRLPERWGRDENVIWQVEVPGWGWSCPVVWGSKVFVTTVVGEEEYEKPRKGLYLGQGRRKPPKGIHHWMVYSFDLNTGKVLWKQEAHQGEPKSPRHPKNTYASETPTTNGEHLYVLFGDVGLYCYDLEGTPIWSQSIEPKKTLYDYGAAASPIVHGNQVIMIYDNQEASYIASYDTKTGQQQWRTGRDEMSSWATPVVWENALRSEVVTPGKRKIRSYDLNGKLLWEMDGRMSNLVIPSPFAAFGMIYITSGYIGDKHRPVYAIKPGASGDITPAEGQTSEFIQWYLPTGGPYNPSPIIYGDYYYTLHDRGFLTCHNARTGQEVYGRQRFEPRASFTASPWAYNGKLFCLSEDGLTYVVQAGPEFKQLHTNDLDELCLASTAACQGKLLIRTASRLYCLSNEAL
ncbi:MAG: outer membrane protein assembly factor BamB family protein [Planctomycetota bacterium]|jgi:outer membrane protein assembly factor BamB